MENIEKTQPQESHPNTTKYQSRDLYLSAFLKSRGLRLVESIREGRTLSFVFEDGPDRPQLVQQFFYDDADFNVNVSAFVKEVQNLKNLIFRGGGSR